MHIALIACILEYTKVSEHIMAYMEENVFGFFPISSVYGAVAVAKINQFLWSLTQILMYYVKLDSFFFFCVCVCVCIALIARIQG